MEIHRQSQHVDHGDEFHDPEPSHVPWTAVSDGGVDVVQSFARRDLEVLLEDFGKRHYRE